MVELTDEQLENITGGLPQLDIFTLQTIIADLKNVTGNIENQNK